MTAFPEQSLALALVGLVGFIVGCAATAVAFRLSISKSDKLVEQAGVWTIRGRAYRLIRVPEWGRPQVENKEAP